MTTMKKLLEANAAGGVRRTSEVFTDFCELAALSLRNSVDRNDHHLREERYLKVAAKYDRTELKRFSEVLALLTLQLEAEYTDALGELYMSLDLGNERLGQFFTPFSVSMLMAEMTIGNLDDQIADRGFVSLNEPTCGSGGMIVAVASVMKRRGTNFQRHLHVTAQDIDITAVHMAYIQMSLIGVAGIVIHGNTLALEQRSIWPTPFHTLYGWASRV